MDTDTLPSAPAAPALPTTLEEALALLRQFEARARAEAARHAAEQALRGAAEQALRARACAARWSEGQLARALSELVPCRSCGGHGYRLEAAAEAVGPGVRRSTVGRAPAVVFARTYDREQAARLASGEARRVYRGVAGPTATATAMARARAVDPIRAEPAAVAAAARAAAADSAAARAAAVAAAVRASGPAGPEARARAVVLRTAIELRLRRRGVGAARAAGAALEILRARVVRGA